MTPLQQKSIIALYNLYLDEKNKNDTENLVNKTKVKI